jgi:TetR/AcrR family transcriptional regulator, multidrug resistance operon repressor
MRLKDDSKEALIREKAIEMIVKNGFQGLSMQKLAKAANISASTIYIYFESKEDLLNKLYIEVDEIFTLTTLKNFDPDMDFEEGLWKQWKNRFEYIQKHPMYFYFSEQFRNSPLIKHDDIKESPFRTAMNRFMKNAVKKGQLADLPVEVFWAIAYGPFYSLVKFHMDEANMAGAKFSLTEQKMKQAFSQVIKALKK